MKATAQTIAALPLSEKGWLAVFADLVKARLTMLVLLTTLVGFYVGTRGAVDLALLLHTLLGTALVASGAAALNELFEREHDARMRRTADRPLPSGRMQPSTVLVLGTVFALAGLIWLALGTNWVTCAVAAISLVTYLFIYTPLKRVTWLNTLVGAVPGGLPPLIGWTAAQGGLTGAGWSLFAILACWQVPHFMAIAWMYRDEYAKAGFVMLPVVDASGRRTARQAVAFALLLLAASVWPYFLGLAGVTYLVGAVGLGAGFAALAVLFAKELSLTRARQLFFASIVYLPLLLGLMVAAKR
jgi:protoheme IX farnesyltransferase